MKGTNKKGQRGFSIPELLVSMTIMLIVMGVISMLFGRAMSVRHRESRRTDALTSAQAALNVISREIANAGFGLYSDSTMKTPVNGIIIADSGERKIRLRSNFTNILTYASPGINGTNDPGEDITYFLDPATSSIGRYDANIVNAADRSSVVVNRISDLTFRYVNYDAGTSTTTTTTTPTADTGRVIITVVVRLDPVVGQPNPGTVTFTSEVTLRNSNYMLQQY